MFMSSAAVSRGLLAAYARQSRQLLRALCTSGPLPSPGTDDIYDEADHDMRDSLQGGKRIVSPTTPETPESDRSITQTSVEETEAGGSRPSMLTVETQNHHNEQKLRKEHFGSERSKSLLEIAGYNDTDPDASRNLYFEDEGEYHAHTSKRMTEKFRPLKWESDRSRRHRDSDRQRDPDRENYWQKESDGEIYGQRDSERGGFVQRERDRPQWQSDGSRDKFSQMDTDMGKSFGSRRGEAVRSSASEMKEYNYGLTGLGKKTPSLERKPVNVPDICGEVLFGKFPVLMALQERRRELHKLFIKSEFWDKPERESKVVLKLAEEQGLEVHACGTDVLSQLSSNRPHQGMCLDASQISIIPVDNTNEENALEAGSSPRVWLLMDQIKDPMNFGAVIRSSYYMGVDRLLTTKENCCKLSPVVSKASAGTLEVVPLYQVDAVANFLQMWKERGFQVVGTVGEKPVEDSDSAGAIPLHEFKVNKDTILIVGNEAEGLTADTGSQCDHMISIQPGRTLHQHMESLNVSVATGIILHHLRYCK